jgi:hypothetical protein
MKMSKLEKLRKNVVDAAISTMNADDPYDANDALDAYFDAKQIRDNYIKGEGK